MSSRNAVARRTSAPYLLIVALILVAGGALRFYRLNWDEQHHTHPDERHIIWVATTIRLPGGLNSLAGWQAAFDPRRSTLNPFYWPPNPPPDAPETPHDQARSFAYGHFPLYALALLAHGLAALSPQPGWLDFERLMLIGRLVSCGFDLGTIAAAFLLGRQVFGRRAGALAAACVALAPLHIQLAHFCAFDTAQTFFVTAALALMARYAQKKRLGDSLAGGVCAGLAVGCKATAVWLPVLWGLLMLVDSWPALPRRDWKTLRGPAAGLAAAGLAFVLTNPFALLDAGAFLADLSAQAGMARSGLDWPYTRQYYNTWPFIYPIGQMLRFSLGPGLTLAGWAGLGWTLWRTWRQDVRLDELLLLAWLTAYFAMTGGLYVKFIRYMLPITPGLAVLAGALLVDLERRRRWWGRSLGVLLLISTGLYGLAFIGVYDGEHPWITASRWIYANIPAGASLAVEHWDDTLPLPISLDGQDRTASEYTQRELAPYDTPDTPEKLNQLLETLANSDYLALSTHRLWGTIPRWPQRYPLTARYYQALFGERLGYRLVFYTARYPRLGPVTLMDQPLSDPALPIPPLLHNLPWPYSDPASANGPPALLVIPMGRADESFTVYDHPLTLIFRNEERLPASRMRDIVTGEPSK